MLRTVLLGLGLLISLPCLGADPGSGRSADQRSRRSADQRSRNLALKAQVSASSELSPQYAARLACEGAIPQAMSHADVGKAWCASGN